MTKIAIMNLNSCLKGTWWALCGPHVWLDTYTTRFPVMKEPQKKMDTCHNEIGLCDPHIDVNCNQSIAWNDHTLQKQICSVIIFTYNMGELLGTSYDILDIAELF